VANVYDVANYFVRVGTQNPENDLTKTKLQKLLYYAQGHHYARYGKPLFERDIKAWDFGPVVPVVFNKYSRVLDGQSVTDVDIGNADNLTEDEHALLLDVVAEYGKYSASYLSNLTHIQGTPWSQTIRNETIPPDVIYEYFRNSEPYLSTLLEKMDKLPIDTDTDDADDDESRYWANYLGTEST
jgi:uncharacterized phage-associated protein